MALISRMITLGVILGASAVATGAHAERHYDCTKPGNANKAACKAAVAPTAPAPAPAATPAASPATASTRHYDCSKPGNANKAACKGATPTTTAATTTTTTAVAPAKPSIFSRVLKSKAQPAATPANTQPSPGPTTTASAAPVVSHKSKSITADAAGATGQCKDGTYTHATHHSGACSSHGGVAKWMQ